MKKIMIIPLDERPCNINYVSYLSLDTPYEVILPNKDILGDKKTPADVSKIQQFILNNLDHVDYIILSIDMLVYGGIVPSRLHYYSESELLNRLDFIKVIRDLNKDVKIYAFNLIMRNPTYSSNDEEPDYYEEIGREIHLKGVYDHKKDLGIITSNEINELNTIEVNLNMAHYKDYIERRRINLSINKQSIHFTQNKLIDYLVIPQDDASKYGLTAMDQNILKEKIAENNNHIIMYPDADAVVNTLFVRAVNSATSSIPKIFVEYITNEAKTMIPKFEDRELSISISQQIEASGAQITHSKEQADIYLYVNAASVMIDINDPNKERYYYEYFVNRDLKSFVNKLSLDINEKPIILADLAYSNGSDEDLIILLNEEELLFDLAAYAAWNTSGNSLGTCIPMGLTFLKFGKTQSHLNFLGVRYIEDYLYMTKVRKDVTNNILPKLNYNYFNVGQQRGEVSNIVRNCLQKLSNSFFKGHLLKITDCFMPWRRMFEVGIDVIVTPQFSHKKHTKFMQNKFIRENQKLSGDSIVFIGDSITEQFDLNHYFPLKNCINRGISGDTALGILNRLKESVYDTSPKKIFLLIGTNDLCNGDSSSTIYNNLDKIVKKIKDYDISIEIYLLSILPIYENSHQKINYDYIVCRSNIVINSTNSLLKSIKNVTYINISEELVDINGNLRIEYTTEGLHITEEGYDKIAQILSPYI